MTADRAPRRAPIPIAGKALRSRLAARESASTRSMPPRKVSIRRDFFPAPGALMRSLSPPSPRAIAKRLRDLLSPEVLEGFSKAISDREGRGEKVDMTLVSIDDAKIVDAQVKDMIAQVTVRFLSKLITATRDRDGKVVDGSPDKVVDVTDVWTFSRDTRSSDPNWQLVATETTH